MPTSATPAAAAVESASRALIETRDIAKAFDQVRALRGVDFDLREAEVHALVGENGAGKSTLIKILAGTLRPDAGAILVDGAESTMRSRSDARKLGISVVFQELASVPGFTVAEYMSLGQAHDRRMGVLVDWRAMRARALTVAQRLGFDFPVTVTMRDLSVAQQRMAEIGQALLHGSRVVVMDEPTASLTDREVSRLFTVIRQLRADGVAVIYVSHRLEEIFELADRVTVFRDGRKIATHAIHDCTRQQLVLEICGTDHLVPIERGHRTRGRTLIHARGVTNDRVRDISLEIAAGEIVGLAGLAGAGRTEVARALYGADRIKAGELHVDGAPVKVRSVRAAIDRGIGLLPEERKTQALFSRMTIRENVTIGALGDYARPRWGRISRRQERRATAQYGEELRLKFAGPDAPVTSLSGGNQQKVVLSRLLDMGARILLLDEPTKGVDVGAKQEMFRLIREFAARGCGVLFISSDLDEVTELCDRALVMREGAVVGHLSGNELNKGAILELAYGHSPT